MEGAFLEVAADLIGSLGVVVAALIVIFTGYANAEPIIAAGIGLFILPRAHRQGRKAVRVLVQAASEDIDLTELRRQLSAMDGVDGINDLHVWTLNSEMPVASAHLIADPKADRDAILESARRLLPNDFKIPHTTLQVVLDGEDAPDSPGDPPGEYLSDLRSRIPARPTGVCLTREHLAQRRALVARALRQVGQTSPWKSGSWLNVIRSQR